MKWMTMWMMMPMMASAQLISGTNAFLPFGLLAYKKSGQQAESSVEMVAAGAFQTIPQVGFHAGNRFMIREMNHAGIACILPQKNGAMGFSGRYSGGGIFTGFSGSASMGMKVHEQLGIGLSMEMTGFKWTGYSPSLGMQAKAGMLYWVNHKTGLGFQVNQWVPIGRRVENSSRGLRELITGIGVAVNTQLYLSLEIRKQTNELAEVSGLVEWQAAASIGLLAAINTTSHSFMMGLTKSKDRNKWGIIFNNHPQLGISGNLTMNHGLAK
jgi:hypothetical protein